MDALSQIEHKYGFMLPSAYRSFAERGYLTYPGKAYLWVHEAEWLPTAAILDQGGFWGRPKPGLVAFAFSGGRDLWAWQTQRTSDACEPAIAYCPRDCYEGWWHAPSLLGWLYRIGLEYASLIACEEAEAKRNLQKWASVLREFEKRQWADALESVARRNVMVSRAGLRGQFVHKALISRSEVNDRILADFGAGFISTPYIWDVGGEPATG